MSLIVQKLGVFIGVFTIKTRKIQHTMLEKLGEKISSKKVQTTQKLLDI